MNLFSIAVAAALLMQPPPDSFLNQRIGDHDKEAPPGMADLTMGQLMQLTALPGERVAEVRCTGFVLSPAYKGPATAARKAELKAALTAAVANDSRVGEVAAGHFLTAMIVAATEEPPAKDECATFVAMTEAAAPIALVPLMKSGAVDPALASCAARYTVAAERADPASRANLAKDAERARTAALAGKQGADRAAAEAAIDEAIAAERAGKAKPEEQDMMGLIMCQPLKAGDVK